MWLLVTCRSPTYNRGSTPLVGKDQKLAKAKTGEPLHRDDVLVLLKSVGLFPSTLVNLAFQFCPLEDDLTSSALGIKVSV